MTTAFSGFLLIGGASYIFKDSNNFSIQNTSNYWLEINGAVYNETLYKVKGNTKLKDVIYRAHLLMAADISKIDLNYVIRHDYKIYIPFKKGQEPKINARDGLTQLEINQLGLNANVSKLLFELFAKKGRYVKWEDIDNLKGVGDITIAKLKSLLIL